MTEMVERLAQAMAELRSTRMARRYPERMGYTGCSWEQMDEATKADAREDARAALAAMRDVDAGGPAALIAGKNTLYSVSEDPTLEAARGCWEAMIDAALGAQP